MPYDRSFSAVFKPGSTGNFFPLRESIAFRSELSGYSHGNAWWLAEFCRLVYRIDNQLKQSGKPAQDVLDLLKTVGGELKEVITDKSTSTCVVLIDFPVKENPTDSSNLLAVFCGSNGVLDWKINFQASQDDFSETGNVHLGFLKSVNSISSQLIQVLSDEPAPVMLAGHSLGAAVATLMTAKLVSRGLPVKACYSFGCPRIGDRKFVESIGELPVYRLVNNCDIVTGVPVSLGSNEYCHADGALFFDDKANAIAGQTDKDIQQRQLTYLPNLASYLSGEGFMERVKSISMDLPIYIADHAISNYANRIAMQFSK